MQAVVEEDDDVSRSPIDVFAAGCIPGSYERESFMMDSLI